MAALAGGCGSSPAPVPPTTARGVVRFQGHPLAGGRVVFAPDPDRGAPGRPIHSDLAADGTFQLVLDGSPAVPPGWYRVALAEPPLDPTAYRFHPPFPPALRRPDRSGLVREVKAGQDNVYEFAVEVADGR